MGMGVSPGPVFLSKKEEDWHWMLAQGWSSSQKKKKSILTHITFFKNLLEEMKHSILCLIHPKVNTESLKILP